jgi:hypothetical protein
MTGQCWSILYSSHAMLSSTDSRSCFGREYGNISMNASRYSDSFRDRCDHSVIWHEGVGGNDWRGWAMPSGGLLITSYAAIRRCGMAGMVVQCSAVRSGAVQCSAERSVGQGRARCRLEHAVRCGAAIAGLPGFARARQRHCDLMRASKSVAPSPCGWLPIWESRDSARAGDGTGQRRSGDNPAPTSSPSKTRKSGTAARNQQCHGIAE